MCVGVCGAKVGISAKDVDGMAARGYEECKGYISVDRDGGQSVWWPVEYCRSNGFAPVSNLSYKAEGDEVERSASAILHCPASMIVVLVQPLAHVLWWSRPVPAAWMNEPHLFREPNLVLAHHLDHVQSRPGTL